MKTTIELPEPAIREARDLAADQGMTLKYFEGCSQLADIDAVRAILARVPAESSEN